MSNTLLTAWFILLNRYMQRDDIVIGMTISGRSTGLPGEEDIIGPMMNTVPIRVQFNQQSSFTSIAKYLQDLVAEINSEYSSTPLSTIQSWSGLGQSLFDILYVFENYPIEKNLGSGITGISAKDYIALKRLNTP